MLDENLPTFFLRSSENQRYTTTLYLRQHGDEPEPAYSLRYLDPSLPNSKNRYATAILDPFIPDILFGEVLIVPEWTQPPPTANSRQDSVGVPPPPEPVLPSQFKIQLYNPDQEVIVHYKPKTWNSPASWDFEMPQQSFRQPSVSTLDRTQSDPTASETTPKLRFVWKKDGTLGKDFACFLVGKSVAVDGRKKSKEPDITISIFKGLKEITLYEPNLYRVEMEDFKGLELVLLLGAVVIRDVYIGSLRDAFHISDPAPLNGNVVGAAAVPRPASKPQAAVPGRETRPPPLDARSKWELEAEAAQLKKQQEAEARERRRREQEAERKTLKLLEEEEKAARLKQAEINKETERLKKLYGEQNQTYSAGQSSSSNRPPLPGPRPARQTPQQQPAGYFPPTSPPFQAPPSNGPFSPANPQPRPHSSLSYYNTTSGGLQPPQPKPQLKPKRSNFFGLRRGIEEESGPSDGKLHRKRSSVF